MARKAKQVEHWGMIDPKVIKAFEKRVEQLREEMIPRDYDHDSPIEVYIVDKRTHSLSAMPVPRNEVYSYDKRGYLTFHPDKQRAMDNETERWLGYNASIATKAVEQYFDERNRAFYNDKEAAAERARPIADRIAEACSLCVTKTGFLPRRPEKDGSVSKGLGYMHEDGTEYGTYCRAYKLRCIQTGRKDEDEPEAEWCPTCRAELGERKVKQGVRGVSKSVFETMCINPQCPKSKPKPKVKKARKPPYKGNIEGGRRAIKAAVKAVVSRRKA